MVNIDNWLMSGILMSCEMQLLVDEFGWDFVDLWWVMVNVMKSVFILFDEWLVFIDDVVKLGYVVLFGV